MDANGHAAPTSTAADEPTIFWQVFRAWMTWAVIIGAMVGLAAGVVILIGSQVAAADDPLPLLPSVAVSLFGGAFMGAFLAIVPGVVHAFATSWMTTRRPVAERATYVRAVRAIGVISLALTGGFGIVALQRAGQIVPTEALWATAALIATAAIVALLTPRVVDRYWDAIQP